MPILTYQIHCLTENAEKDWYLPDSAPAPTTCPTNSAHQVDPGSVVVLANDSEFKTTTDGTVVVSPTTPLNQHTLQPLGLVKKRVNPTSYAANLTIAAPNGDTFSFSSSLPPIVGGMVCSTDFSVRVPIASITENTLTVESGLGSLLTAGQYILSNPLNIDYVLPADYDTYELWGVIFDATGYGTDDFASIQLVDTYGEITGGPAGTLLLTYDTVWIGALAKMNRLMTPDGTPGELPATTTIRIQYFCSSTTSGQLDIYLDHVITVAD